MKQLLAITLVMIGLMVAGGCESKESNDTEFEDGLPINKAISGQTVEPDSTSALSDIATVTATSTAVPSAAVTPVATPTTPVNDQSSDNESSEVENAPQQTGEAPDLTDTARSLGVTVKELQEALGGPPPDFATAAEVLGITLKELMQVFPAPPNGNVAGGQVRLLDVHGAGAQRSDPKSGDPADWPEGHGPQGDVIRIFNLVRPVRNFLAAEELTYPIVDTNQSTCYNALDAIECGTAFAGQDAEYDGHAPSYQVNGDGTVSDLNTGLKWQQDPGDKVTWDVANTNADDFILAGYDDWRLPTIKELYSLIQFSGTDPSPCGQNTMCDLVPFIDDSVFDFKYGDENTGDRMIDSQWATSNLYVDTGMAEMFGVNFADGRIKGYPLRGKGYFTIYVRGNQDYGLNVFQDNGDGTVSDTATGLMWLQDDSGGFEGADGLMDWEEALSWAENLEFAGYGDWRLPNAKELHSILDYTRSPGTTNSAAIDPIFASTPIVDEGDKEDYGFYWSGTTHATEDGSGRSAVYLAFGRALGFMQSSQGSASVTPPDTSKPDSSNMREGGRPEDRYACHISPDGYCVFTGSPHKTGLKPRTDAIVDNEGVFLFFMDEAVAVNSSGQTLEARGRPAFDGDELAVSVKDGMTEDDKAFHKVMAIMFPIRNALMYDIVDLSQEKWDELTMELTKRGIKETSFTSGATPKENYYGRQGIFDLAKSPGGRDIHHPVMKFLEESGLYLLCHVTSDEFHQTLRETHPEGQDSCADAAITTKILFQY